MQIKRSTSSRVSVSLFDEDSDGDPLSGLTNLFDVAMVFAVALMVALVSYLQVPALLNKQDYTIITNPGTKEMEIIVKDGEEIKHYEATDQTGVGKGELLGQAYKLPDGRVVYVPAGETPTPPTSETSNQP
jgi:hypothetical protein